jgi:D-alanyl-D-alanine-carboxypeptidase/D-alanyl-D-alanine-endopeptidase
MALATAPFPAAAQTGSQQAIRDILKERIEVGRQSVGMVAVTLAGGQRELATYGSAGTSDDRPLDIDSVFEIGSITKVFTALLLADMVQRKEVALDDPVVSLLPGAQIPEKGKPITLLDLATYTSSLPRMPSNFHSSDPKNPYADYGTAQMMEFLASYELKVEPGTHYEYANLGFGLLGLALATRAGKSYEALVVERICAPLGMNDTRIALTSSMKARAVQAHDANLFPTSYWDFQDCFAGAGALRSTANDLCRFVEAASGTRESPLKEAFALMLATQRPAYKPTPDAALGWFVSHGKLFDIVWKDGGTGGTCSFIGFAPQHGRGAVLLSNAGYWNNVNDIGYHLIDPDLPVKPQRPSVPIDAAKLERLVGSYKFEKFVIAVTRRGPRLFAQLGEQPAFEVFATAETEFFYRVVDARLTFEIGPDGYVAALVLHQNNRDRRGTPI